MKTLERIRFNLFLLSIALIPLTISDKRLVLNLGEYRNETYIYPLLILVFVSLLVWLIRFKVTIPLKSVYFQFLILFVISCLVCSLLSLGEILTNSLKNTSGIQRLFRQLLSLFFSVLVVPIVLYDILRNFDIYYVLKKVENIILFVLTIVFSVAVIEICSVLLGYNWAYDLINWFNELNPFLYIGQDFNLKRISSISHEPPFLGMFLVFSTPWVLRKLYYNPKGIKGLILLAMSITLILVSKSRAAQLFCLIQIVVFVSLILFRNYNTIKNFIKIGLISLLVFSIVFIFYGKKVSDFIGQRVESFNIVDNIETSNSNKTRLGTIIAGLEVFYEHPISGVGYGQQAYYIIEKYPEWAKEDNIEIKRYMNKDEPNFPPGFNFYVRILAETGIIGFVVFGLFITYLLYVNLKRYLLLRDIEYLMFLIIFIGLIVNWIQIDTPRIFSFWITLILFLVYDRERDSKSSKLNYSNPSLQ